MDAKHLLLPSAKAAVLVPGSQNRFERYAYGAAIMIGLFCVLWGAADLTTRLAEAAGGKGAGYTAFVPLAALESGAALGTSTPGTIVPHRLTIPALGISAEVEQVGTKEDGSMESPKSFKNVGWYVPGARPGAPGSTIFAGHVNNALSLGGVFEQLSKIRKGEYVTVSDEAGKTKVYKVVSVEEYPASAPTETIFATSGAEQLVLITCDGEWVPSERTFDKRLVVIAKPAY